MKFFRHQPLLIGVSLFVVLLGVGIVGLLHTSSNNYVNTTAQAQVSGGKIARDMVNDVIDAQLAVTKDELPGFAQAWRERIAPSILLYSTDPVHGSLWRNLDEALQLAALDDSVSANETVIRCTKLGQAVFELAASYN
jgi:hypothetical protein